MKIIEEIKNWKGKPKELITFLTKSVKDDKKLFAQLVECLKIGSAVEKGICGEVMKYVTEDNPEFSLPYIDTIIEHINDEVPKVKWETARVVGNVARKFPEKVSKAVPKILSNTKDSGTVTRWCAAYALTEIAKNNLKSRNELLPKILEIVKKEKNNGVKNVYLKALKIIKK